MGKVFGKLHFRRRRLNRNGNSEYLDDDVAGDDDVMDVEKVAPQWPLGYLQEYINYYNELNHIDNHHEQDRNGVEVTMADSATIAANDDTSSTPVATTEPVPSISSVFTGNSSVNETNITISPTGQDEQPTSSMMSSNTASNSSQTAVSVTSAPVNSTDASTQPVSRHVNHTLPAAGHHTSRSPATRKEGKSPVATRVGKVPVATRLESVQGGGGSGGGGTQVITPTPYPVNMSGNHSVLSVSQLFESRAAAHHSSAFPTIGIAVCVLGSLALVLFAIVIGYRATGRRRRRVDKYRRAKHEDFQMTKVRRRSSYDERELSLRLKTVRENNEWKFKEAARRQDSISIPPPQMVPVSYTQVAINSNDNEVMHPSMTSPSGEVSSPDDGFVILTDSSTTIIKVDGCTASLPPSCAQDVVGAKRARAWQAQTNRSSQSSVAASVPLRSTAVVAADNTAANSTNRSSPHLSGIERDAIFGSSSHRTRSNSYDGRRDFRRPHTSRSHEAGIAIGTAGGSGDSGGISPRQLRVPPGSAATGGSQHANRLSVSSETLSNRDGSGNNGDNDNNNFLAWPGQGAMGERRTSHDHLLQVDLSSSLNSSVHHEDLLNSFPVVQDLAVDTPTETTAPLPPLSATVVQHTPQTYAPAPRTELQRGESVDIGSFEVVNNDVVRSDHLRLPVEAQSGRGLSPNSSTSSAATADMPRTPDMLGNYDTIPRTASMTTATHSPFGQIHFKLLYSVAKQRLTVRLIRAENLSLDKEKRQPNTLVKVELRPPTTADTASAETEVFLSSRNPKYNEEVMFTDYSASEISLCSLNLKVYNIPPTASLMKPQRKRIGVARMRLRSLGHDRSYTLVKPLESGERRLGV